MNKTTAADFADDLEGEGEFEEVEFEDDTSVETPDPKAAKKAALAASKAAAKAAKEELAARKKEEREAAKAEKLAKAQEMKEAKKAPREEQNGVVRPKTESLCGQAWTACDDASANRGQPASIHEVLEIANERGLNIGNVKVEYARWKKFHGLSGRILSQNDIKEKQAIAAEKVAKAEAKAAAKLEAAKAKEAAKAAKAATVEE